MKPNEDCRECRQMLTTGACDRCKLVLAVKALEELQEIVGHLNLHHKGDCVDCEPAWIIKEALERISLKGQDGEKEHPYDGEVCGKDWCRCAQ